MNMGYAGRNLCDCPLNRLPYEEEIIMATNEDIMDTLSIIQSHIITVESALEEVKSSRQEAVAMNEYDRNAIMNNISEFELSLVNNIKDTIVQQQIELKSYHEEFNEKLSSQNNKNKHDAEALFLRVERATKNISDLNTTVSDSVNSGFENLHLGGRIEKIMQTSVKEALEKQTEANKQAVIDLSNTAKNLREKFTDYVYFPIAFIGMFIIGLAVFGGFKLHELYQRKTCENVFEQFYSDRFNEELEKPLKEAKLKAAEYLDELKQEAEDYKKLKEQEADDYLKNKIIEADEEYTRRLQAYIENAKDEVSKSMKKNAKKGDN